MIRPAWGWDARWFSFPATQTWGFPWGWCGCFDGDPLSGTCSCGRVPSVTLGAEFVASISSVLVDGSALPSSAYRIDDHRILVRTDGLRWPRSQNMLGDPTIDTNTFQVTFTAGKPLPAMAVRACATLACELALACLNDKSCRLPRRAVSVARQGVSMNLADAFAPGVMTGIPEVDQFIVAVNPKNITRGAIITNPDVIPPVRHVGAHGGS